MFKCLNCNKEFSEKYSKWSNGNFCSKKCARQFSSKEKRKEINEKVSKTLKEYFKTHKHPHLGKVSPRKGIRKLIEWECPYCGKIIELTPYEAKRRKFCSGTCRNNFNNKNICGSRSIAEDILFKELTKQFPSLKIIKNDRSCLNGLELDIYIPYLKIAIEWNGIFHYKDVHKNGSLEKIQKKDILKEKMCKNMGIDLIIIKDLTSNRKFILNTVNKIITYIKNKGA